MNTSPLKRDDLAHAAVTVGAVIGIAVLHHYTPHSSLLGHNFFQWLYYLPVVYAAAHFGLPGGVATAMVAALGYLPHFLRGPGEHPEYLKVQYAEVGVLLFVSVVTGMLADLERKRRIELENAKGMLEESHRELQASFEQLKRADRLSAIGQLTATMAHEIRNPLAGIRGAVDVLNGSHTPEAVRQEFREIIVKESARLERLLTSLLNYARPRTPQYRQVDVAQCFDLVTDLLAFAASTNGIELRKEVAGLPPVECDPEQINQVLLNLVLNAIQAMTEGGEIVLSACLVDSQVLIEVQDGGCGFSGDTETLFEPFFSTKENGTGLGLSVARQILSQHGGAITARRNPSRGMTFSILLPVHQPNSAATA
ncbi:MAG: ATP-binding protein [Bryobacteraceae bacterium]